MKNKHSISVKGENNDNNNNSDKSSSYEYCIVAKFFHDEVGV